MRETRSRVVSVVRRSDEGFALVFTMGAVALITAVAVGGYMLANQTLHDSNVSMDVNRAYQLASTGLEQELSFFTKDRLSQYPKTVSMDGGTYVASVNDLGGGVYELAVRGTVGTQEETVLTRFQYLNLWDMNISGGAQSSIGVRNGFNGNSTIIGSLYVNGNMDWGSNGRMWGGPVFVKDGTWNASGNGQVGSSTDRVDAYGPVPSDNDRYFTDLKGTAPDLEIPRLTDENMAAYLQGARDYAVANPRTTPLTGTQPANQDPTYYTVFNGNTTFNSDFGDITNDAIAVRAGVVYLKKDAIIYVDGTATFGSSIVGYRGSGTIVAKNGFVTEGSLVPQNGLTETLYGNTVPKMDETNCLGLLSQGDFNANGKGDTVCAAVFLNGNYIVPSSGHSDFRGSMITNSIQIDTTNCLLATQPGLGDLLPAGMPQLAGFVARGDWVRR